MANRIIQDELTGPFSYAVICPKGHRHSIGEETARDIILGEQDVYDCILIQLGNMDCETCLDEQEKRDEAAKATIQKALRRFTEQVR